MQQQRAAGHRPLLQGLGMGQAQRLMRPVIAPGGSGAARVPRGAGGRSSSAPAAAAARGGAARARAGPGGRDLEPEGAVPQWQAQAAPPSSCEHDAAELQQPAPAPGAPAAAWPLVAGMLHRGLLLAAVSGLVLAVYVGPPSALAALRPLQLPVLQLAAPQRAPPQAPWLQQHAQQLRPQAPPPLALGSGGPQQEQQQQQQQRQLDFELASELEDGLLESMRQVEAGWDRAFGALSSSLHAMDAAEARSEEQAALDASARALIQEVWEVVDVNYLDARRSGFDHERWAALRDEALSRTYHDSAGAHRAVRDMLARGVSDPYCRFIEPREFAVMKKYDVTGVGLNLGTGEEYVRKTGRELPAPAGAAAPAAADGGDVWVVGISKGSEAERAGVQQGDRLLQVAGVPLSQVTPFQAATLIAGPDDSAEPSAVGLRVRKADGAVLDVSVQRPARALASPVTSSLQQRYSGEQVGVIRLTSFNARALRDVSAALDSLQQAGATELVLDLRDNRGGLVSEGLEVARLFLSDRVPIVHTQSKAMAAEPPLAGPAAATQLPLTVLVNEHTASASEILAGALKDNCRGVLVGQRTYGKGLIQSVYELSDSSGLVITVGKYFTPRGTDIDRFGIAPNFSSLPAPERAADALEACRLEASSAGSGSAGGARQAPAAQLAGVTAARAPAWQQRVG